MKNNNARDDSQNSWIIHFIELRTRVFRCVIILFLVFLALYYYSQQLYSQLASPLLRHLTDGNTLIATSLTGTFLAPLKLSLFLALFLTIPVILHQLWGFICPGLYQKEKRWGSVLLISSIVLFYLGVSFAFFIVFPLIVAFFAHIAPVGVAVTPDISIYLDFSLKLFFAFGLAFEVPVAIILLVWTGIISINDLTSKRPYIIVISFVIAMFLTPPDVISQTMLAIPLCLLFELGIFISRFLPKSNENAIETSEQ